MAGTLYKKLKTDGSLPTPPGVVVRLLQLTQDQDSALVDIVKTIESDPSLVARVMKFANSPLAGAKREVKSLQEAAIIMGMRGISMLALSLSVLTPPTQKPCPNFKASSFRLQSLACGVAARTLAASTGYEPPQEAFLAGMMSQMGRAGLAIGAKKEYNQVLNTAQRIPADLPNIEMASLKDTYAGVGSHILREWGFPSHLCDAVSQFRTLEDTGDNTSLLSRILCVSEIIASILCPIGEPPSVDEYCDALRTHLGIGVEHGETFIHAATTEFENLRQSFAMPKKGVASQEEIEAAVRSRVAELSLATFMESRESQQNDAELLKRATIDPLTDVSNRAAFNDRLELEIERCKRTRKPLGLVMLDVDHFKKFNDSHGHLAGDEVLQAVASALKESVRTVDLVARFGGEEFSVIAPEMDPSGVEVFAERLRASVENARVQWEGRELKVTISIGISLVTKDFGKVNSTRLIQVADKELYGSKEDGRNRFRIVVDGQPLNAGR